MSGTTWNTLSERLQESLAADDFSLWIEPLTELSGTDSLLKLGCPNRFHLNWIRDHYLSHMRGALSDLGHNLRLTLEVVSGAGAGKETPRHDTAPRQLQLQGMGFPIPILNKHFVFDSFVTGQCNEFACAAAKAMAGGQNLYTNSLFLVSGTGLGKSHLTQAVGHQMLSVQPKARVAYLTVEDFTNQMVSALRKKRIQEFKDRFRRQCDILLLEEVQFLAGKKKTQDELGYTLDTLMDAGKKIIFTGSEAPEKIKGINSSIKSRLAGGITVPIEPPDHGTRLRILQHMMAGEGQSALRPAPQPVLEYLAEEISGDIRRLQSALVGLMARSSLTGRPMDLALAAETVGHMAQRPGRVSCRQILEAACDAYSLEQTEIAGKTRRKAVTRPRNLAMYICRRHTDESYAGIGKVFNRDHATVMYGVRQVERKLPIDTKLAQEKAFLEKRLGLSEK